MPRLLISYRREDTTPYAGRLYDRLSDSFGHPAVFMDVDAIEPGEDFIAAIERALSEADVLLALIGPRWTQVTGDNGERRLDDPMDYVRVEIGTALARGMRVIPILVGGAVIPRVDELPDDLVALSLRQAYLVTDVRFHADVDALIRFLRSLDGSRRGAVSGSDDRPSLARGGARPQREACEAHFQQLLRSPWLEGNLLWSLGMLSGGLYYFFVAATVVQQLCQLLTVARGERHDQASNNGLVSTPNVRRLVPGALAHGVGWLLTLGFGYAVVAKPAGYDNWVDELIACVAIAFWAGAAWLLVWLWGSTRTLAARFAAASEWLPASWSSDSDPGRWQAVHVQKIVAFLLMFAFEIYLLLILERAVTEGMERSIALESLFRYISVMIALPVTLMQCLHCLAKDMLWKLLRHVRGTLVSDSQRPWLARALRASWFWLWMYLNAGVAAYAFYLAHESAIALIIGR